MNVAYGIAAVAALLQLQEPPDMTNTLAYIQPYFPDTVYAGAVVVEDHLTYVGGMDWKLGKLWGVGAEYRYWRADITFNRRDYDTETHAAGGYAFRELPPWQRLTLRTELGGAVVWASSSLSPSTTWAVGMRAVGHFSLTDRIDVRAWVGSLRIGSSQATDGRVRGTWPRDTVSETGIALRVRL